jgi:hypothetical protein
MDSHGEDYEMTIQLEHLYYNRTPAALKDELIRLLSSKCTAEIVEQDDGSQWIYIFHPYLQQAEHLLYKINIYKPLPQFVIWLEDIPNGLAQELKSLGKVMMKRVITDAVRRVYESVDPDYYYKNGIHGKVKWRFGKTRK